MGTGQSSAGVSGLGVCVLWCCLEGIWGAVPSTIAWKEACAAIIPAPFGVLDQVRPKSAKNLSYVILGRFGNSGADELIETQQTKTCVRKARAGQGANAIS